MSNGSPGDEVLPQTTLAEAALSREQRALLAKWMSDARLIADLSWRQTDTLVLHVRGAAGDRIVKAGGPDNHHIGRDSDGHLHAAEVWAANGHSSRMLHADRDARILLLEYLPGTLAFGTAAALDPAVHLRAGQLLRALHDEHQQESQGVDAAATLRAVAWLDSPHAIDAVTEERLRGALAALPPREESLVPAHGDWQPRNWLVDGAEVRVIDFGRFAFRPRATDFARMSVQEWRENPTCEAAFIEGYGYDPRHPEHWKLILLREAIGTAVWAHQVGDVDFEQQGHRMIADALVDAHT